MIVLYPNGFGNETAIPPLALGMNMTMNTLAA
jgi:hypothetical protein